MATKSGFDESRAVLRNDLALINHAVRMLSEAEEVLDRRNIIEARSATDCLRPRELSDLRRQVDCTTRRVTSLLKTIAPPSKETELVIEVGGGDEQHSKHTEAAGSLARSIIALCETASSRQSRELTNQEPTMDVNLNELHEEHELLEGAADVTDKEISALKCRIQQLKLPVP